MRWSRLVRPCRSDLTAADWALKLAILGAIVVYVFYIGK